MTMHLLRSGLFSLIALAMPLQLACAQDVAAPTAPPRTTRAARGETVKQITDRLTLSTGVRVIADSALSRQSVAAPEGAVTKETLDDYLTRLSRRLTPGTVLLKVYLPPATYGPRQTPDAIAKLARAQMDLMGRPAPNTVQIQGRTLTTAEAEPIVRTLGLEPVYVLTSRMAETGAAGLGALGPNSGTAMMDALMKQLGVGKVEDIPTGSYKVNLPGPDGNLREATVEVENSEGKRRISVRMGDTIDK